MDADGDRPRRASAVGLDIAAKKKSLSKESMQSGSQQSLQSLPDLRGDGPVGKTPNKAMTKAERRAIQEAQRAAKAAAQGKAPPPQQPAKAAAPQQKPEAKGDQKAAGKPSGPAAAAGAGHAHHRHHHGGASSRLELFSHLPINDVKGSVNMDLLINQRLHPAVIQAGLWFNRGLVAGSNDRCRVMLDAFKQMIMSYEAAADKELRRDLEAKLRPHISFLTECRPMSVSMRNAIKFLKLTISNLDPGLSEQEAKQEIVEHIDNFVRARIDLAVDEISKLAAAKIVDGDVIMLYMAATTVEEALKQAHTAGRSFRVIIVDSRPLLQGRALIKRLSDHGILCSYVLVNGASYVMKEATKVFMGAHTFFANGHMMAPAGSSVVAMVAKSCGVPVIVCCETYKFWAQRVQTDSFVFNELANPDDLVKDVQAGAEELRGWREKGNLHITNLGFDVTPPDFIDMVITEIGLIPCTSVPVILREFHGDYDGSL